MKGQPWKKITCDKLIKCAGHKYRDENMGRVNNVSLVKCNVSGDSSIDNERCKATVPHVGKSIIKTLSNSNIHNDNGIISDSVMGNVLKTKSNMTIHGKSEATLDSSKIVKTLINSHITFSL